MDDRMRAAAVGRMIAAMRLERKNRRAARNATPDGRVWSRFPITGLESRVSPALSLLTAWAAPA
jgi:hypothetical protein